jgi:hypothetical protein
MPRQRIQPSWTVEQSTSETLFQEQEQGLNFYFTQGGTLNISSLDSEVGIDGTYGFFWGRASYWFRWSDDDENFLNLDSEDDFYLIVEQTDFFSMRPQHPILMPPPDDGIPIIPTNPDEATSDFYFFGIFSNGDSSLLRNLGDSEFQITTLNPLNDEAILQQFFIDGVEVSYSTDYSETWTGFEEILESSFYPQDSATSQSVPEGSMGFGLLAVGVILFGGICKRKLAKMFG